jgi:serine/threonine protein kinase
VVVDRKVGEALARRVERDGRLAAAECARLLDEVVEPLSRLHERGMVHGAIDARSVFLERPASADEAPRALLLARGVARILEAGTATSAAIAAPVRAPEQIPDRSDDGPAPAIGPRTDAFALAAVLYLALTGRAPFVGRTAADTKQRILSRTFDPPSSLRRELHPSVDAFFRRAFAVDPERRFGSVREMAAVFRRVIDDPSSSDGIPQLARTQLTTLPPRPSRGRPALRIAALAAVLAAGAIAGAAWLLDGPAEVGAAEPPPFAHDAAR